MVAKRCKLAAVNARGSERHSVLRSVARLILNDRRGNVPTNPRTGARFGRRFCSRFSSKLHRGGSAAVYSRDTFDMDAVTAQRGGASADSPTDSSSTGTRAARRHYESHCKTSQSERREI